jgi:hypothetical protein
MRALRMVLVLGGALAMAWGGWLLTPELTVNPSNAVSVVSWTIGGPVLHDALFAPVVGLLGLVVAATVPAGRRPLVATGLVVSGALVLVALPVLLRPSAGPPNPGLADRDYPLGLAIALATVWLTVLAVAAVSTVRARRQHTGPVTGSGRGRRVGRGP